MMEDDVMQALILAIELGFAFFSVFVLFLIATAAFNLAAQKRKEELKK